jgi:ABC-2 type transport system ATP-binding protein
MHPAPPPGDDTPPLLLVDAARVQFNRLVAVNDVSFTLRAGDLLGLIGPNGAGKTTLLRAIAGLQPLTTGEIRVIGEHLRPASNAVRHVGFSPDTPPLYEELTVRNFLRFIGRGYDLEVAAVEERIDFWLEKVWLTEKSEQKIKGLSRGMRQRVGIARTLMPNPHVILLDEPAAGLDPAGRVQFRQLLSNLRDQGKTLIVSSHILADMQEYCTHIGIMSAGRMINFGTVAHVAGHADATRCRYKLHLAHPVADLASVLAVIDGVSHVEVDRDRAALDYLAGHEHAAHLLASLVHRKVPVSSFTAVAPGLEEAYLRIGIAQVD